MRFFFTDLLLSICREGNDENAIGSTLWSLNKQKNCSVLSAICTKFWLFLPFFKSLFTFRKLYIQFPPHMYNIQMCPPHSWHHEFSREKSLSWREKRHSRSKKYIKRTSCTLWRQKTHDKLLRSVNDRHVLVSLNEARTAADRLREC